MVSDWDQVSGVEFYTCFGPSRCLPTVCIPAVASFHLIKAELCYHQFKAWIYGIKLSSALFQPCFNVATSSTGAWEDAGRPPSWNLGHSSIARLDYATICNSAAWSLQFLQKPAANLDAQAVSPLQWPSHVAMLLAKQRLQQLRSLSASTAAEKYAHRAVEVYRYHQDLQPQCFGQ